MKTMISVLAAALLLTAALFLPVLSAAEENDDTLKLGGLVIEGVLQEEFNDQLNLRQFILEPPALLQVEEETPPNFMYADVYELDLEDGESLFDFINDNEPLAWEDAEYRLDNEIISELPEEEVISDYQQLGIFYYQQSGQMTLEEPGLYLVVSDFEAAQGARFLLDVSDSATAPPEKPADEETVEKDPAEEKIVEPEPVEEMGSIDVTVDGELLEMDVAPTIEEGRTLVPMRAIFERLGAQVNWDEDTRTVTGVKDDTTIVLPLGDTEALVDGLQVEIDVPADTIEGRTMVPARFIAETLGANVVWEEETRTVVIES